MSTFHRCDLCGAELRPTSSAIRHKFRIPGSKVYVDVTAYEEIPKGKPMPGNYGAMETCAECVRKIVRDGDCE